MGEFSRELNNEKKKKTWKKRLRIISRTPWHLLEKFLKKLSFGLFSSNSICKFWNSVSVKRVQWDRNNYFWKKNSRKMVLWMMTSTLMFHFIFSNSLSHSLLLFVQFLLLNEPRISMRFSLLRVFFVSRIKRLCSAHFLREREEKRRIIQSALARQRFFYLFYTHFYNSVSLAGFKNRTKKAVFRSS